MRHRAKKASFWQRVLKAEGDGCWIWLGTSTETKPYGNVMRGGRIMPAHRAAWEASHGPIPDGLFVCHTCDNRECVRPDHLFLGTQKENMHDGFRKGRLKPFGRQQLQPASVLAIRRLAADGKSVMELSKMFRRGRNAIRKIVACQSYAMIRDPEIEAGRMVQP